METSDLLVLLLLSLGLLGKKPKEGDTKCTGYDLYKYQQGEWVLEEHESVVCGWQPVTPPPPPPSESLHKGANQG